MVDPPQVSRRRWLTDLALGLSVLPWAAVKGPAAAAADAPLISEADPAAVAVHYVEDVRRAAAAKPGSTCDNCSLFTGETGATAGGCTLFTNKWVKAAGWCSAWTNT